MRFLLLAFGLAVPASAATTPAPADDGTAQLSRFAEMPVYKPGAQWPACPPTAAQIVAKKIEDGRPPAFHKLTELPPATTYMAVERHIGGCEAPMTMVEYRTGRRR